MLHLHMTLLRVIGCHLSWIIQQITPVVYSKVVLDCCFTISLKSVLCVSQSQYREHTVGSLSSAMWCSMFMQVYAVYWLRPYSSAFSLARTCNWLAAIMVMRCVIDMRGHHLNFNWVALLFIPYTVSQFQAYCNFIVLTHCEWQF